MISECHMNTTSFGKTPKGEEIELFTLEIPGVIKASIMNLGATLTSLHVPDRFGKMDDIVLGFDSLEGYFEKTYQREYCYLGSTIGRVAGRTKGNQFELDGRIYQLPINQGDVHLHGGMLGWDRKLWDTSRFQSDNEIGVKFSLFSPDGEEGYPGNVKISVWYVVNLEGELKISYEAVTDQATIINPTNHSYFNLSGDHSGDILDHELSIQAQHYLPIDSSCFTLGGFEDVSGTPFDFRKEKNLGIALADNHPQMKNGNGIDHAFKLDPVRPQVTLSHPRSGRRMICATTAPAVQVYTSNHFNGSYAGKSNSYYKRHAAICLETQGFPNAANRPDFPSIRLNPGETFRSQTTFKFTID
ncbi:aldose 1-epimerase [Belliella buryatensis]|uniref:Aldose 1-epimerase n=1 Tax=Belliella buryatensis TaxID=1500549 RepID=A0A239BE60_9BACT|nr:aldose epimerase family protein [Belliella buryatensis]SNS05333.1 aldose 1-epimerase [Belliella buryatensis]